MSEHNPTALLPLWQLTCEYCGGALSNSGHACPPRTNMPANYVRIGNPAMPQTVITTTLNEEPVWLTPAEHGQAGARDALDGVGGGVPLAVRKEMQRVILAERFDFTTDLLDGRFSQATRDVLHHKHHRNALAGMITTLAKAGRIRFTGRYVRSVRPEARGRMLKVWEPA